MSHFAASENMKQSKQQMVSPSPAERCPEVHLPEPMTLRKGKENPQTSPTKQISLFLFRNGELYLQRGT